MTTRISTGNHSRTPGDNEYLGTDGLLHCSFCHEAKEKKIDSSSLLARFGTHPIPCACEREIQEQETKRREEEQHRQAVERLRSLCFPNKLMWNWTFEHTAVQGRPLEIAKDYVKKWSEMCENNIGLMFWGEVGTGKSYLAGCIANALIDQEVSARMTNLAAVLGRGFGERYEFIRDLCSSSLLIIDDLGMERDTSFALEAIFEIIDARAVSGRPLILTTNLTPGDLKNPPDLKYKRIYDRIMGMTVPAHVPGPSFRSRQGAEKMQCIRQLMEGNDYDG